MRRSLSQLVMLCVGVQSQVSLCGKRVAIVNIAVCLSVIACHSDIACSVHACVVFLAPEACRIAVGH